MEIRCENCGLPREEHFGTQLQCDDGGYWKPTRVIFVRDDDEDKHVSQLGQAEFRALFQKVLAQAPPRDIRCGVIVAEVPDKPPCAYCGNPWSEHFYPDEACDLERNGYYSMETTALGETVREFVKRNKTLTEKAKAAQAKREAWEMERAEVFGHDEDERSE